MSCLDVTYAKFTFMDCNCLQTYRTQECERHKTEVCLARASKVLRRLPAIMMPAVDRIRAARTAGLPL